MMSKRVGVAGVILLLSGVAAAACTAVPQLGGAVQISAGQDYTCALLADGTARCWGDNQFGQLGSPIFAVGGYINVPVPVAGLTGATQIIAGTHSCTLQADGGIKCWGFNYLGDLGHGTYGPNTNSSVPVDVVGITSATAISRSCALIAGGAVKCWGLGAEGELGNGANANSPVPVDVVGITSATAISGNCALIAGGAVKCWGYNAFGQLGNGTISSTPPYGSNTPVNVVGIAGATQIASGYDHVCALVSGGTVKCWGFNRQGQLGDGATSEGNSSPVDVIGISGATQITAGGSHTCALVSGGTVKCWGINQQGELGNASTVDSLVPVDVAGLAGATQVTAGGNHTCALMTGGTVKCWGHNAHGELGNGAYTSSDSDVPVDVVGIL